MSQAVLYDVQGPKARRRVLIMSLIGTAVLLVLAALVARRLATSGQFEYEKYEPFFTEPVLYERLLLVGLKNTLIAAAYALVLALLLGTLLAFGRLSHRWFVRAPATLVVEVFRGLPLLLLILGLFLGFPAVTGRELSALWSLVIALTLYNGSVIAEIIRAGVLSVPKGQSEAAFAMGLGRGQTLRLVLLPQAVRTMLPALISQLVVLLKDTSLGFVITYLEILRIGGQLAQRLDNPIQMYVFIALVYIIINGLLGLLARYVEGRQRRTGGRTAAAPAALTPTEAGAVL